MSTETLEQLIEKISKDFKEKKLLIMTSDGYNDFDLSDIDSFGVDNVLRFLNRTPDIVLENARKNPDNARWVNDLGLINLTRYLYDQYLRLHEEINNLKESSSNSPKTEAPIENIVESYPEAKRLSSPHNIGSNFDNLPQVSDFTKDSGKVFVI